MQRFRQLAHQSLLALLEENKQAFWKGTDERRARIDAYDAATGALRWRFYTSWLDLLNAGQIDLV